MGLLQEWIPDKESTFKKFRDWINQVVSMINNQEKTLDTKSEVVLGTYKGNGETSRFINLGFTPIAVEVYTENGMQAGSTTGLNNGHYGGLALKGHPCGRGIKVVENGFNVTLEDGYETNSKSFTYYFKAYKPSSYEIINIT